MSIEFPLSQKSTPFGPVSDPKILVGVRTLRGYIAYRFLVDTGADFSLAPRRLAQQIGLDWDALPEGLVAGIEQQRGIRARLGPLPIQVGGSELTVRCLFPDAPTAPFILGRADFLDRFVLTIDARRQTLFLTENP